MAGNRAQQAAIAISMKKKGEIPKGYHKMPDGRIMKDSAHKKPKAQAGAIIKTVVKAVKSADKGSDVTKSLSQFQKMRKASGKPISNLTMKEQMAKKALQEAIKKRTGTSTKKLTKEQQYLKDVMDSYMKKGGSVSPAWQRSAGKNPEGGLNAKGVASYRKANPGSKLQTAVTTKPSKLKAGSKDAKRRKSFCSRMEGMKKKLTSSKTANDPNSRINKSLRKWNC